MLLSVFLTYHVRIKIALPRTFSSRRVTLGNPKPAIQCHLWPIPVFLTYHVRMKIAISRTFCSVRVTLGNDETAGISNEWLIEVREMCFGMVWVRVVYSPTLIRT